MRKLTFKMGGIHPADKKISSNSKIEILPLPEKVYVSMAQHLGAPATPVVAVGDTVKVGDVIAEPSGFVSAYVHSPVSGVVKAIAPRADIAGNLVPHIEIEVSGDEWREDIDLSTTLITDIPENPADIINKVKLAGVVGLGGATFPTHIKLSPPPGKKAECIILNGAECEPYLTSDNRIMIERSSEIIIGAALLSHAMGDCPVVIAIEENKNEAIMTMSSKLSSLQHTTSVCGKLSIKVLQKKYPQGGEKQLIDAVMGRQVPSGTIPIDVGAVVQNVRTALAVYEAVQKNRPLITNVMTVTGDCQLVQHNYQFRIGTPLSFIAEQAGGVPASAAKIISGGPMMGKAISNMEATTVKGTSSLLYLTEEQTKRRPGSACIRCGRCAGACPMGLEPYLLFKLAKVSDMEALESNAVQDCIECGCCLYSCPASVPLLDMIRPAKADVLRIIKTRK